MCHTREDQALGEEEMKKPTKPIMHCSICGAEHDDDRVKDGWFAVYKTDKRVKIKRLICPDCLQRLGVKVNQS